MPAPRLEPDRTRRAAWHRVAILADAQHGIVSRAQLRDCGLTDHQVDRALADSRLHVVHRGVFVIGRRRLEARSTWSAAVLACGPRAALACRSAAALHGLRPTTSPDADVLVRSTSRPRHRAVRVRCHPGAQPDEVQVLDGIRVTTVARTLLDLAALLPVAAVRRAVGQADVLRVFDLHEVAVLLERHHHHRGRGHLAVVLESWETPDRLRSPLEEGFPALCARFGFPRPVMNAVVLGMEVDAVFFDQRVAVELDGYTYHSGAIQWENDHEKRARLVAAGWTVLAYSPRQLRERDGEFVRDTLGRALARGRQIA